MIVPGLLLEMMSRVAVERHGKPLTLRLADAAGARGPYGVARTLAAQGIAVFPVRGRQPLTDHGVYSATCDLGVLAKMPGWARADGCGLATGEVNGVAVLDLDVRCRALDRPLQQVGQENSSPIPCIDGHADLAALGELPLTLVASSPSNNGRHFYFRYVAGARSKDLAKGLQWFSDKKLVVVPPAPGRQWLNDADVAVAPEWLQRLVLSENGQEDGENFPGPLVGKPEPNAIPFGSPVSTFASPYTYNLLVKHMRSATPQQQRRARGLYSNLEKKRQGRNDGLNWTAFQFRELVNANCVGVEGVCKLLVAACRANGYLAKDGEEAVRLTIMSGLGIKEWPLEKAA